MRTFILLNLSILFLFSCSPSPKLVNYYFSDTAVKLPNVYEPSVSYSVFSMPVPPKDTAKTTLLNLSEKGQAAFINTIGHKTGNELKEFIEALATPIKPKKISPTGNIIENEFERRLIFSFENESELPADRIL